jgi:molecular chaperone HtpG
VSEEEYREFYKHIAHDWSDPLERIAVHMEGTVEARALLFVPAQPPLDLFQRDAPRRGLHLYAKRVFIMDDCRELLPEWLRFIRGVVASDDVSLNVSRELLQQDRQIQAIRRHLVRRLLAALGEMKSQRAETYRGFWASFGPVLKEGLFSAEGADRDRLLELVLAGSTHAPGAVASLGEYVGRAPAGHDAIYYITGPSRAVAEASPHLEALRARGEEVLIFADPVDEVWLGRPLTFGGRRFVSVTQGELPPAAEGDRAADEQQREAKAAELGGLLDALRAVLQDRVSAVRLSARLTSSPACLVSEAGEISGPLRELLRRAGQELPVPKRALEINGGHPLIERLRALAERDGKAPELATAAELLYGQAVLVEGGSLDDPAAFGRRLAEMMERAL